MKIKIMLSLILLTGSLLAQDSTKTIKLKSYWNIETESGNYIYNQQKYFNTQGDEVELVQITDYYESDTYLSFGLELGSNERDNFHEIELKKFKIKTKELRTVFTSDSVEFAAGGSTDVLFNMSINYEYNFRFFKKSKKNRYFLGLGANPYFTSYSERPQVSTQFENRVNRGGVGVSLVPRIQFRTNKKVGFEMKMQIEMMNLENIITSFENPSVPVSDRKLSSVNFTVLGADRLYSRMSFGINYKI